MKTVVTLILFFSFCFITSQNIKNDTDASTVFVSLVNSSLGNVGTFVNYNKTKIEGNTYVFPNWKNTGLISIDDENYRLRNINFNIETNNFESQVGRDSVFILDLVSVNHIYINDRKFESFYFPQKQIDKGFEIIYDREDFKLLKGFELGIKYGDTDPLMIKKKTDEFFTTKTFYIKKGYDIQEITLKKKVILSLLGDKASAVANFVKERKLSYKKEKDLKKILSYYDSL